MEYSAITHLDCTAQHRNSTLASKTCKVKTAKCSNLNDYYNTFFSCSGWGKKYEYICILSNDTFMSLIFIIFTGKIVLIMLQQTHVYPCSNNYDSTRQMQHHTYIYNGSCSLNIYWKELPYLKRQNMQVQLQVKTGTKGWVWVTSWVLIIPCSNILNLASNRQLYFKFRITIRNTC